MHKDLRIIFMGTPEFAVPSLRILLKNYFNVVAIVTAPDKPAGRGLKIKTSPVKDVAVEHNIPVLQPDNLKSPEFIKELKSYEANLQIVVAFRMLPEVVWNMPEIGTFNLHASLLPQYRGAAPINWAIINGETETGVSTFFLKHEIDTGDILFQEKEPIYKEDNAEALYGRLMAKGAELVYGTVRAIQQGTIKGTPQVFDAKLKTAPKLSKEICRIDWSKTSLEIYNFVRGLSPYPAAWTRINDKDCKIFQVKIEKSILEEGLREKKYLTDNKTYLHLFTGNGVVAVEELQMEGKKRMLIDEFLRGNKL
jgi:methionyl-tRNA formyltransferase